MIYSFVAPRDHCFLSNGVKNWAVFLSKEIQKLFKCMNPEPFSQQSLKPESSRIQGEEGWGLTNRTMFQNLLRVPYNTSIPFVPTNRANRWRKLGPEQRWRARKEKYKTYQVGEREMGPSSVIQEKLNEAQILTKKVRVPNPPEEMAGCRHFGQRIPNSLSTTKVIMAILQVSHCQELYRICCLMLHNKETERLNGLKQLSISKWFFGLVVLLILPGLMHEAAVSCGSAMPGLSWHGWDSLSMWSVILGFIRHGGLRVPRRQAPVHKHLSGLCLRRVCWYLTGQSKSHSHYFRVNMGGVYTSTWVPKGINHWGILLLQCATHSRLALL